LTQAAAVAASLCEALELPSTRKAL